jgi:hypothetical protein
MNAFDAFLDRLMLRGRCDEQNFDWNYDAETCHHESEHAWRLLKSISKYLFLLPWFPHRDINEQLLNIKRKQIKMWLSLEIIGS